MREALSFFTFYIFVAFDLFNMKRALFFIAFLLGGGWASFQASLSIHQQTHKSIITILHSLYPETVSFLQ